MTLPGLGPQRDPGDSARVNTLVTDLIDDANVTVLVTELECSEPGCPPIETVIALLSDSGNTQYKVHKPVADVRIDDVRAALDTPTDPS
ncbi:MAG: hypothetical protein AAGG08_03195 [Actinomycetota bacterium]